MPKPKCGANTKAGTPCKLVAGYRTDHYSQGKCFLHGGCATGAPIGNSNALVTGEYERITYSALSAQEQTMWDRVPLDPREQVELDLRLVCIRIHRMLLKITAAKASADDDGMLLTSVSTENGFSKTKVNLRSTESHAADDTIYRLEDAITRTAVLKVRIIEQLRGVLKENPPESGGLEAIVDAIDRSAAMLVPGAPVTANQIELDHAVSDL